MVKAIQYAEHGTDYSALLKLVDIPASDPPAEGFATVKISAASGNPIDYKVMSGGVKDAWDCPLPMVMGYDFSGTIVSIGGGDSDSDLKVGDEVFAVNWGENQHKPSGENATIGGAFAESITVPLSMLSKKPAGVSHEQAAALALIGTTAHAALFDCLKVKKGDKVLILGGPTAVGSLAIQLAKNAGAWVATTASTRNIEYVEQFGPDLIVDYRKKDWSKDVPELVGIDAVFDAVGETDGFTRAATDSKVIKDGGSFVSIASYDVGFDPAAHQPRLEFGSFYCLSNSATVQDSLAADVAAGNLKVIIDKSFPFSKEGAVDMMKYIEGGTGRGKNVMTM